MVIVDEFIIHCKFVVASELDSPIFLDRWMPWERKYVAQISLKNKRTKNLVFIICHLDDCLN